MWASTQKLVELIKKIQQGDKINIQKSVAFFILTMKYQNGKAKNIYIFKSHQKE